MLMVTAWLCQLLPVHSVVQLVQVFVIVANVTLLTLVYTLDPQHSVNTLVNCCN